MNDISISNITSVFSGPSFQNRFHLYSLIVVSFFGFQQLQGAELPPAGSSRVYVQIAPNQKDLVITNINRSGGTIHYEFDSLGAVAATLPDRAINALNNSASVLHIEPDPARYLLSEKVPWGVKSIQADLATGVNVTGNGVKVGVIDSGIFTGHEDFLNDQGSPNVIITGYPEEILTTIRGNGKPKTEIVSLTPDDEQHWARDRDGHGTHVSGTILAAANGTGVVGVAPGVSELYMVKVFGDDGSWVYSSSLLNAVQQAKSAGVQVINMSLGGSLPSSTEESGMAQAVADGIILVAAAGNEGSTSYNYPASYDSVISVAATAYDDSIAGFSQKNDQVELAAPGVGVVSSVPYIDGIISVGTSEFHGATIENSIRTNGVPATGQLVDGLLGESGSDSWSGKVVLISRGNISFLEKVQNVEASGGEAAIIYNNAPGGFLGTLGNGNTSSIPAVAISKEDGETLLEILNTSESVTPQASVVNDVQIDESGYQYWEGTSMATPHVTGAVALLLSKYPDATPAQVREALTSSAKDLGIAGWDTSFGYGLVQAADALSALDTIISNGGSGGDGGDGGGGNAGGLAFSVEPDSVITNSKNGSFEITWETNQPADGKVTIGTGEYYSAELTTVHRFKFRGQKGATYDYTVNSSNSNGSISAFGTHLN